MKPFHAATMPNLPNTVLLDSTKTVLVRFNDTEGYVISVPNYLVNIFKLERNSIQGSLDSIAKACDKFGLQMLYVKGEK